MHNQVFYKFYLLCLSFIFILFLENSERIFRLSKMILKFEWPPLSTIQHVFWNFEFFSQNLLKTCQKLEKLIINITRTLICTFCWPVIFLVFGEFLKGFWLVLTKSQKFRKNAVSSSMVAIQYSKSFSKYINLFLIFKEQYKNRTQTKEI